MSFRLYDTHMCSATCAHAVCTMYTYTYVVFRVYMRVSCALASHAIQNVSTHGAHTQTHTHTEQRFARAIAPPPPSSPREHGTFSVYVINSHTSPCVRQRICDARVRSRSWCVPLRGAWLCVVLVLAVLCDRALGLFGSHARTAFAEPRRVHNTPNNV